MHLRREAQGLLARPALAVDRPGCLDSAPSRTKARDHTTLLGPAHRRHACTFNICHTVTQVTP